MSKITGLFIFASGVVTGSVITWQYAKKIYEQRAQEEIDSVKSTYKKLKPDDKNPTHSVGMNFNPEKKSDTYKKYYNIAQKYRSGPYVISPDEFGEIDDYAQVSLTYYADQVLADDTDEKIEDVDNTVGVESLTHFGEYEDDSVFVRNDRLKCDYEILMDIRTYSEVLNQRPHQKEAK